MEILEDSCPFCDGEMRRDRKVAMISELWFLLPVKPDYRVVAYECSECGYVALFKEQDEGRG